MPGGKGLSGNNKTVHDNLRDNKGLWRGLTDHLVGGAGVAGEALPAEDVDCDHPELHLGPDPQILHAMLLRLSVSPE